MAFVETDHAVYFYGQRDPKFGFLSNFHPCEFTDSEGRRYFSSEQFFMKRKQEMFDPQNEQLAIAILKTKTPPEAKKLGRQVGNYDDQVWGHHRYEVMLQALKLKFSSDEDLAKKLLVTGSKTLYEAAHRDAIWGIGLGVSTIAKMFRENESFRLSGDVDAETQHNCFGLNLLGNALMETRAWLQEQEYLGLCSSQNSPVNMEVTMEVLRRPADAPRSSVRVISRSSMSLSFAVPASFLQARQAATNGVKSQHKTAGDNSTQIKQEDSWEDHDWDNEQLQDADNAGKLAQTIQDEADDWEQESPDLPDDFPRLVVNLTRVQRQHFPPTEDDTEGDDMMEVFQMVKTTLQQHFSTLAEVLFEQKACFHCTYGTSRAMMDGLHAAYPEDTFAMLDYPTVIDDVPLHEYLHTLSCPTQWKSVEYLKDCLRRCSRDIRWKRDVVKELELLAEQEHEKYAEQQQNLSDEIDELTRLRDSFREKLEKMTSQEGKVSGQYLLLRKLEDIENRLVLLLDQYLKEPELEEEECYSAFGNPGGEAGPSAGMNVLDMIIAMVFGRLPRDFSQKTTSEEHFQMLFDHHIHILRLWKKDFGRLPPKKRVASPQPVDSDAPSVHESSSGEHDVTDLTEEVAYCEVEDEEETVDVESESESDNEAPVTRTAQYEDLDGYGADFDSEESEDEEELAEAAVLAKLQQQKLEEAKASDTKKSAKSARPRRRRVKLSKSKHAKRLEKMKAERHEGGEERDAVPFQPFACTGAVGLLRLAKENEMF